MVEDILGFIQAGYKGFLGCLGLESNAPPSQPPPAPATADEAATTDPLLDVLPSSTDTTTTTTMDLENDVSEENTSTLVTIDELINSIGNTTGEAQYVELVDTGETNTNFLAASLISSGGPGGSH